MIPLIRPIVEALETEFGGAKSGPRGIKATTNDTVGALLQEGGFALWKVDSLLARDNGVSLEDTNGSKVTGALTKETTVNPGQTIFFPAEADVLKATQDDWQQLANAAPVDYAMVGVSGGFGSELKGFLGLRQQTILWGTSTLDEFVESLNSPAVAVKKGEGLVMSSPVREFVLGAHANFFGEFFFPNKFGKQISYNDLVSVAAIPNSRIWRLDGSAFLPRPNRFRLLRVRLIGCNIGRTPGFIKLLRKVMNADEMIAPRNFVQAFQLPGNGFGIAFYLDLRVAVAERLASVGDAIDAINATKPQDLNGNTIEIPADFLPGVQSPGDSADLNIKTAGAVTEQPVAPGLAISTQAQYRFRQQWLSPQPIVIAQDPGSGPARIAAAMAEIKKPRYGVHDDNFPIWERFGEVSEDIFVNTWKWQFQIRGQGLSVMATRFEYQILFPAMIGNPAVLCCQLFRPNDAVTVVDNFPKDGDAAFPRAFTKVVRG